MYALKLEHYNKWLELPPHLRIWLKILIDGLHADTAFPWRVSPLAPPMLAYLRDPLSQLNARSHLERWLRSSATAQFRTALTGTVPPSSLDDDHAWGAYWNGIRDLSPAALDGHVGLLAAMSTSHPTQLAQHARHTWSLLALRGFGSDHVFRAVESRILGPDGTSTERLAETLSTLARAEPRPFLTWTRIHGPWKLSRTFQANWRTLPSALDVREADAARRQEAGAFAATFANPRDPTWTIEHMVQLIRERWIDPTMQKRLRAKPAHRVVIAQNGRIELFVVSVVDAVHGAAELHRQGIPAAIPPELDAAEADYVTHYVKLEADGTPSVQWLDTSPERLRFLRQGVEGPAAITTAVKNAQKSYFSFPLQSNFDIVVAMNSMLGDKEILSQGPTLLERGARRAMWRDLREHALRRRSIAEKHRIVAPKSLTIFLDDRLFITKAPSTKASRRGIERLSDKKSQNLRMAPDFAKVLSSDDVSIEDPMLALRLADLNAGSALPWAGESASEIIRLSWELYNFRKHYPDLPVSEGLREALKYVTCAVFTTLGAAVAARRKIASLQALSDEDDDDGGETV